jgi:hypothetical protein
MTLLLDVRQAVQGLKITGHRRKKFLCAPENMYMRLNDTF